MPAHRRQQFRLVEIRVILGLQHRQRLIAKPDRLIEQSGVEIGDADMAGNTVALCLGQSRYDDLKRDVRVGPVDHHQIDIVEPERLEAFLDRTGEIGRSQIFVADFGGDENFGALKAGGSDRLADQAFGAVFAARVDVAIANLERGQHRVGRHASGHRPGAVAERRN